MYYHQKVEEFTLPEDLPENIEQSDIKEDDCDEFMAQQYQNMKQQTENERGSRLDSIKKASRSRRKKLTIVGPRRIKRMPHGQITERINSLLDSLQKILDPTDLFLGVGDLSKLMECKAQDQQDIKWIIQNIYLQLRDGFSHEMKSTIKIKEYDISWYEVSLDMDINQDFILNEQRIWKQKVLEKTLLTHNYYEACFIGYLRIFKEIAVSLLGFADDSPIQLTQFLSKFCQEMQAKQKLQYDTTVMFSSKDYLLNKKSEVNQDIKYDKEDKYYNGFQAKQNKNQEGHYIIGVPPPIKGGSQIQDDFSLNNKQGDKLSKMLKKYSKQDNL